MTLQHSTIHYGTKNDKKPQKLIRYYRGIPRYDHYLFCACTEPHQPTVTIMNQSANRLHNTFSPLLQRKLRFFKYKLYLFLKKIMVIDPNLANIL